MNSELRQDLVSGDWVVIAPSRAQRPHGFFARAKKRRRAGKRGCPFEDVKRSGHSVIFIVSQGKKWELAFVSNKYPVFRHKNICALIGRRGPYAVTEGVGHHETLITRDHDKNFVHLSDRGRQRVFEALRDRALMLRADPCIAYVSLFHNWGPSAGASLYHPHYQLLAIPVVPPDVELSLAGASRYYRRTGRCVHCAMIAFERKERKRVLYENDGAIAFAPYVSRAAFEVRVFPTQHLAHFENSPDLAMDAVADALRSEERRVGKECRSR